MGANIKIKNRLRELMQQPGGRSVVEALRGAEARLGKIKDQCLDGLDELIARMAAAAAELDGSADPRLVAEIYQASNDVITIAGLVGYPSLDEVAHGLCELIDRFRAEGRWSAPALRVHIEAMQVLRGLSSSDDSGCERVLTGLRQVWSRFGLNESEPPQKAG